VNANGLFVAGLVLKADADEIAGFEHLGRRLHKAALVAVEGLQRDETGQGTCKQYQEDQCIGPPTLAEKIEKA
jgi:hypothetical protein